MLHTAEIISVSYCTPGRSSQLYTAHCGINLRGVKHTTETICAVCGTLQSQSRRCAVHRGDDLSGMQHTEETISAVCSTPRKQSEQCATHHRDNFVGVQYTAETNCTPQSKNRDLHLSVVVFKGVNSEHIYHKRKDLSIKFKFAKTNFVVSAVCVHTKETTLWSNISTKSKPIIQEPRWVRIMKKQEVENLVTLSL